MNRLSSQTSASSGGLKGIRDMRECYISTRTRRGSIPRIFKASCEIGTNNFARKLVAA